MQVMRSYATEGSGTTLRTSSPEVDANLAAGPTAVVPARTALSPAPERGRVRQAGMAEMAEMVEPAPWIPANADGGHVGDHAARSEEHTSELQSLMRTSYAVFCLKKKIINTHESMN